MYLAEVKLTAFPKSWRNECALHLTTSDNLLHLDWLKHSINTKLISEITKRKRIHAFFMSLKCACVWERALTILLIFWVFHHTPYILRLLECFIWAVVSHCWKINFYSIREWRFPCWKPKPISCSFQAFRLWSCSELSRIIIWLLCISHCGWWWPEVIFVCTIGKDPITFDSRPF